MLGKIIPFAIFAQKRALPCVMKVVLTEKLFGVGSSNFGFVRLDNWATHYKKIEQDPRTKCVGISRKSGHLTWNDPDEKFKRCLGLMSRILSTFPQMSRRVRSAVSSSRTTFVPTLRSSRRTSPSSSRRNA